MEVVERKGLYKTTSMEIATMYLQLTDLEAAGFKAVVLRLLKLFQVLL